MIFKKELDIKFKFLLNNKEIGFSSFFGSEPDLGFFKDLSKHLKSECLISFQVGDQKIQNTITFTEEKYSVENNFIPYAINDFVSTQKERVKTEQRRANFTDKLIDVYYIPASFILSCTDRFPDFIRSKLAKDPSGKKFFISHPWLSKTHPDPDGKHFSLIKEHAKQQKDEVFYWFDYSCLPQEPRTQEDEHFFKKTLPKISTIQSKGSTIIIAEENYNERMWCYIEHFAAVLFSKRKHGIVSTVEYIGDNSSYYEIEDRVHTLEEPAWDKLKVTNPSDIKSIKYNYRWLSNLVNFQLYDRFNELRRSLPGHEVYSGLHYFQSAFGLEHRKTVENLRKIFYEFGGSTQYFFKENSLIWLAQRLSSSTTPDDYNIDNLKFSRHLFFTEEMVGWIALLLAIIKTTNIQNDIIFNFRELYSKIILISQLESKIPWIGDSPVTLSEDSSRGLIIHFECTKCNYESEKLEIGMSLNEDSHKHPLIPCVCLNCNEFRLHPIDEITWENNPKLAWASRVGNAACSQCQTQLSIFELFKIFVFVTPPNELVRYEDREYYKKHLDKLTKEKYKCVKCGCQNMNLRHDGYHV